MKLDYILLSCVIVLFATSCTDELESGHEMSAGDEIVFSASTNNAESRTSYGELSNGEWPVYWEAGDVVAVYCPQAGVSADNPSVGTKYATYTVTTAPTATRDIYDLTSQWGGLYWSEEDIHDFYTFYPATSLYLPNKNGTAMPSDAPGTYKEGWIVAAVPREQNAVVTSTGSASAGYTYTAVDMNAAIMAGKTSESRENYDGKITLPFTPITTAIDIELSAPQNIDTSVDGMYDQVTITSIQIANVSDNVDSRTPLAGGFYWNHAKFEAGSTNISDYFKIFDNSLSGEQSQSYTINILFEDGIVLRTNSNDKLTVTAFLLPTNLPENMRVIVNCKENVNSGQNGVVTKIVKKGNEGKKCTLTLGMLPNPIVFSYETWMANLDEDVYVSQISLPGTHDAGAYDDAASSLIENLAITQIYDIPTQFNNGVRVLDFRPECSSDNSEDDFDIAHGLISLDVTFEEVLNNVVTWLANHPTEFIIVQLKNESSSTLPLFGGTKYFDYWQRFMRDKLLKINKNYVIDEFSPTMTLKDARGKILFMSRDDYYSDSNYSAYGGWIGCKVSGWDDNSALWSKTFYTAPHHENSNEGGVGTLWVSDLYKGGTLQNVKETVKKDAIDGCLNAAKNNTDISTWYMTWLNVSDSGTGISNPGRKTPIYNSYVANKINSNDYPNDTYYNTGIIMVDWAGNTEYSGDVVLKAIIDNNFKGKGPAKKQ